jgi:ABC-2 type transport system ATP-binding protein
MTSTLTERNGAAAAAAAPDERVGPPIDPPRTPGGAGPVVASHSGGGGNGGGPWGIELVDLTRRFGKQVAVDRVTLRVARGRTLGFVGLNGAGKTTTIRMMVGLLAPTSGTIRVAGCEVPRERDRLKPLVGYVPDRPTVYSWMRVREAVDFCRAFYPRYDMPRVTQLMKAFDLDPERRVKHLSKGNAAKLSLLLAVGHGPEVLVLDEPMSGLDPLAREQFLEGVLSVAAGSGQTVLFSSHSLADVTRVADEVAVMHEGRLLLHSPIDELLARTKRLRAVLAGDAGAGGAARPGDPPPGTVWQPVTGREWVMTVRDFLPAHAEMLRATGRVEHVAVEDLTLDEVFKDLVRGQQQGASAQGVAP